ncbi:MAG: DUF2851 family protein [Dehalococcoidales bacterium]
MLDRTSRPREAEVVVLWERLARVGSVLRAETGEQVRVVYPGRANDGRGADFTDVVVAIDGRRCRGDIEIHVRSSDWRSHGHHRDAAYDRVVLHVVMWNDDTPAVLRSGGGRVPVVALEAAVWPADGSEPTGAPCRRAGEDAARLDRVERPDSRLGRIERAGEARFLAKAAAFADDLTRMAAGQALYRGIMAALGYTRNKAAFLELAGRAPLAALEGIARVAGPAGDCPSRLRDYLLAVAGLSGADGPGGEAGAMSPSAWQLFRVRPAGSPARRLAAMGHLIGRYRRSGLLAGLMAAVAERALEARCHRSLEDALVVAGGDRETALLGRRCAAEIVVNVLLPFAVAWARREGNTGLERSARAAYLGYPSLPDNAVVRHMRRQLGLVGRDVASACRQQGLMHVYRTRCTQGKCPGCRMIRAPDSFRLGNLVGRRQPEAGDDVDVESVGQP